MTKREKTIEKLIKLNLELCYNDSAVNDGMLHDLLVYGFKGFEHMTNEELATELQYLKGD
jgi:hypothetical protein